MLKLVSSRIFEMVQALSEVFQTNYKWFKVILFHKNWFETALQKLPLLKRPKKNRHLFTPISKIKKFKATFPTYKLNKDIGHYRSDDSWLPLVVFFTD